MVPSSRNTYMCTCRPQSRRSISPNVCLNSVLLRSTTRSCLSRLPRRPHRQPLTFSYQARTSRRRSSTFSSRSLMRPKNSTSSSQLPHSHPNPRSISSSTRRRNRSVCASSELTVSQHSHTIGQRRDGPHNRYHCPHLLQLYPIVWLRNVGKLFAAPQTMERLLTTPQREPLLEKLTVRHYPLLLQPCVHESTLHRFLARDKRLQVSPSQRCMVLILFFHAVSALQAFKQKLRIHSYPFIPLHLP